MSGTVCPVCKKSQTKKFAHRCEFCGHTFIKVAISASTTNLVKTQPSTPPANSSENYLLQEQKTPIDQGLNGLKLSEEERLFGEVAISLGFVTVADVVQAISDQKVGEAIGEKQPIGAYLFERKKIIREQISQILQIQAQFEKTASSSDNHIQNNSATFSKAENHESIVQSSIVVPSFLEKGSKLGSTLLSYAVLLIVGYLLINWVANEKHETNTYYSISAILSMAAKKPSIEVISAIALESMKEEFLKDHSTDDVEVKKINLRHKSGNQYIGTVEAEMAGREGKFTVYVTSDGESVSWETQKGWRLKFLL